jgi:glutamate-5-semialdehyde dehydrogenase
MTEINTEQLLINTQKASYDLTTISEEKINQVLNDLADLVVSEKDSILIENKKDLDLMDENNPKYDRLKLTSQRISDISKDIKNVANLDYPVGKIISQKELANGLKLTKISVAIGVIGIIYESRPNVTLDVFSLCLKSGNACVLKGGKEADYSNKILVSLIKKVLEKHNLNTNIVLLMDNDREVMKQVLNSDKYIDVIIPRGSQELINYVRKNSSIPVIETGAGIVHTYIDENADLDIAKKIIFNAKTRRPSVCNSLDTLIIHKKQINNLPQIISLMDNKVEIFADETAYNSLKSNYNSDLLKLASESDFGIEFLSLKMSIKTVENINEALEHIQKYSSKHSEAIISNIQENIDLFLKKVDAAALYVNTSTAFTDGAQFGMGAEIGISTQKLHARGPMALNELTSYKWIVLGNGQIRS